ncbi:MAG: KH domain-containing protein [Clostridiales bacterium]|nr:KH domain-containing protein [Clostridiales bacterium]
MEELVLFIAKSLVDNPDLVKTTVEENENEVIITLSVGEGDMGKVIGKQGRIAKAIRTVVHAASVKQDKKYIVSIA